jgi:XTP/dITP diphosphohydrolase
MVSSEPVAEQTYHAVLQSVQNLIAVVAKLRSPDGGCPWDLEQTPETLIPYVIEEAYEVVEAIQSQDQLAIAEELGDLMLQVVLQAQIASEYGHFSLTEVAQGITDKLIRRHPHVFGEINLETPEQVRENWEKIKATEKGQSEAQASLLSTKLRRYARNLPPLMASSKISQKAAKAGFEWENIEGVWDKFEEELAEFKEALAHQDQDHASSELGDLLFTLVNLARWYDLDISQALQGTNKRFIQRFSQVESMADRPLNQYTLDQLESLWQKAKQNLHNGYHQ